MQKDMLWTGSVETRATTMRDPSGRKNKAILGATVSRLAEGRLPKKGPVAWGLKIEDRLTVEPNTKVWGSLGFMRTKVRLCRWDVAYKAWRLSHMGHGSWIVVWEAERGSLFMAHGHGSWIVVWEAKCGSWSPK